MSIREASRQLGISRNTAKKWLEQSEMVEPRYPKRASGPGILGPYEEVLAQWLKSDSHRNKRERRGTKALFEGLRALGYPGIRVMYMFVDDCGMSMPMGVTFRHKGASRFRHIEASWRRSN